MKEHHILYTGAAYDSHFATRKLRNHPGLIAPMEEDIEAELHKQLPIIPLLGHHAAMSTVRFWNPSERYIRNVNLLMTAIEAAVRTPQTRQIERMQAELTVHALECQIPYLKAGLISETM